MTSKLEYQFFKVEDILWELISKNKKEVTPFPFNVLTLGLLPWKTFRKIKNLESYLNSFVKTK